MITIYFPYIVVFLLLVDVVLLDVLVLDDGV
jgi:hypothetical protein